MLRRFTINFAIISMLVDAGMIDLALYLAALVLPLVRTGSPLSFDPAGTMPYGVPLWTYAVFPFIWVFELLAFSLYDGRRHLRLTDELATLTFGSLLAVVSLSGFVYLTAREVARSLFLVFVGLSSLLLLFSHLGFRAVSRLRVLPRGRLRHILILGAGSVGREMEKRIQASQQWGLALVGFLDDDAGKRARDPRILGPISETRKVILENHVEEVVLALPSWASGRITIIVSALHDLPVKVWVIPDYFVLALNQARMEDVAGLPLMDLRAPALNDYQLLVKRIFDIIVTLIALAFAIPVMAVVALAIRLDSPGPILFRQKRIGENGRPFEMLKFRSMVVGAEDQRSVIELVDEQGRIVQDKNRPDPRVTRAGRFIRRTSLDELPQLFNVLRGDMSLIGPRPELPHLVAQYEPWQRRRFAVPQGITGWWQVNGRSDKPMHQHTEEDLYYVKNYSIWLDIQILVKTFWSVISRHGAV